MRVLVIPDVHLKPHMFDLVDEIDTKSYDKIVCLGDLVDDWDKQLDAALYERTLDRVLKFDLDHPDMLWCLGNHDLSYIGFGLSNSGHCKYRQPLVARKLATLREQAGDRVAIIHRIDDCLFSHAGLAARYVDFHCDIPDFLDEVLNDINDMLDAEEDIEELWESDSPVWLRPEPWYDHDCLYGGTTYFQVTGHTPVKEPQTFSHCDGLFVCDVFSTRQDGTPIGNQQFVIVDTETREWCYAE